MLFDPTNAGKVKANGSVRSLCTQAADDGAVIFTEWARMVEHQGLEPEDATGVWRERVGILPWDAMEKILASDRGFPLGRCGENICVTSGDLSRLEVGDFLVVGKALLVVSELGKTCLDRCAQGSSAREACAVCKGWIYATVVKSGQVCVEDAFVVVGA